MEKTAKRSLAIKAVVAIMLTVIIAVAFIGTTSTYAEETAYDEVSSRGIFAKIVLDIEVENSRVIATVKNIMTLGSSIIPTYVELYTSIELCSDFHDMTLVSRKYDSDLDMGGSMSVDATGRGEQKYWVAVARYKVDNQNWTEMYTRYIIVDADGNYVATV